MPIRTPADAIGEQRFSTILSARLADDPTGGRFNHRDPAYAFALTAITLNSAVPFLWSDEMRMLALSSNLPRHTVSSEILPHDRMYWTLTDAAAEGDRTMDAIVVERSGNFVLATTIGTKGGKPDFSGTAVRVGSTFPDDYAGEELIAASALLRMLSFLTSRYVVATPTSPDRDAMRKIGHISRRTIEEPEVMVVSLRAPVPALTHGEPGTGRDWKHRWMVRGHHRAQWYPSLNAHKVVWIAPHFKGPADKPLMPQVYAVVR
jgi:hypothetical protein